MIEIFGLVNKVGCADLERFEIPAGYIDRLVYACEGKNVIVGRRTWELGIPSLGKQIWVLSRRKKLAVPRGIKVLNNVLQAPNNSIVIGGISTFSNFLTVADCTFCVADDSSYGKTINIPEGGKLIELY